MRFKRNRNAAFEVRKERREGKGSPHPEGARRKAGKVRAGGGGFAGPGRGATVRTGAAAKY